MYAQDYGSLSTLIKAIRSKQKISQREMAERLGVSSGYVGQWELGLSQPSPDLTTRLCRTFLLEDEEYVHRLVFAAKAPVWLRDSILSSSHRGQDKGERGRLEQRVLSALRHLPLKQLAFLAERIDGWVDGVVSTRVDTDLK